MGLILLHLFYKDQSHQVLFPEPIIVIDGFVEVSFFIDIAQVVAQIKRVFSFFKLVYFVDDLGFEVRDFVVKFGLLWIGVQFAFEALFAHRVILLLSFEIYNWVIID